MRLVPRAGQPDSRKQGKHTATERDIRPRAGGGCAQEKSDTGEQDGCKLSDSRKLLETKSCKFFTRVGRDQKLKQSRGNEQRPSPDTETYARALEAAVLRLYWTARWCLAAGFLIEA